MRFFCLFLLNFFAKRKANKLNPYILYDWAKTISILYSLSFARSFHSSIHSFNRTFFREKKISQHEHDYLISHSHNLRIFIRTQPRDENESRVKFIILINVENVSDVGSMWNTVIIPLLLPLLQTLLRYFIYLPQLKLLLPTFIFHLEKCLYKRRRYIKILLCLKGFLNFNSPPPRMFSFPSQILL